MSGIEKELSGYKVQQYVKSTNSFSFDDGTTQTSFMLFCITDEPKTNNDYKRVKEQIHMQSESIKDSLDPVWRKRQRGAQEKSE